jgi:AraC family transcriptional regulator of adaptative response/methylated-DNA-[protein]-cysteine methyltransferase
MYAVGDSALGRLLVAATSHGICSVNVGDDEDKLVEALRQEYPKARIVNSSKAARLLHGLNAQLRGQAVKLPLDIRGTAFQRRVWEELQRIPAGETRTYSEIARRIGRPEAVRAVARACATNSISVVVPCHRVVGKNGSLTGYRWGLERKRALLTAEKRGNMQRD